MKRQNNFLFRPQNSQIYLDVLTTATGGYGVLGVCAKFVLIAKKVGKL